MGILSSSQLFTPNSRCLLYCVRGSLNKQPNKLSFSIWDIYDMCKIKIIMAIWFYDRLLIPIYEKLSYQCLQYNMFICMFVLGYWGCGFSCLATAKLLRTYQDGSLLEKSHNHDWLLELYVLTTSKVKSGRV